MDSMRSTRSIEQKGIFSMGNVTFTVTCTMSEEWADYFASFLTRLQRNGMIGHSEIVGFDCDGDGDFRPIFSSNYVPNHLHEVYITECPQITMINGVDI